MHLGVLVEARRQAHRIGQLQPGQLGGEDRIVRLALARTQASPQRLDAQIVCGLGVQPPQQGDADPMDQAHAAASIVWTDTARAVGKGA